MHLWHVLSITAAAHSLSFNAPVFLEAARAGDANNLVILQSPISSLDKSYSPLGARNRWQLST